MKTAFCTFLLLAAFAIAGERVILQNQRLKINFDPATLAITTGEGIYKIIYSAPQSTLEISAISDKSPNHVSVTYKNGLKIALTILDSDLSIEITAAKKNSLTFPLIPLPQNFQALIWPNLEGKFIPLEDRQWQKWLSARKWNTMDGLTMPFWSLYKQDLTLTYFISNRFHNRLCFNFGPQENISFTHDFQPGQGDAFQTILISPGPGNPILPALKYRKMLSREELATLSEKQVKIPSVGRLKGALHAWLSGTELLSYDDVLPGKWRKFAIELLSQSKIRDPNPGKLISSFLEDPVPSYLKRIALGERPSREMKVILSESLSNLLRKDDFYDQRSFAETALSIETRVLLSKRNLSEPEIFRMNSLLLYSAFPDCLREVSDWGFGTSSRMLNMLQNAGIDRAVLRVSSRELVAVRPEVVKQSVQIGYLFGEYCADNISENIPFNHYFLGNAATGQVYDDFSPAHPATQMDDAREKLSRLCLIRDKYKAVLGSDGGCSYFAPAVHFMEGMHNTLSSIDDSLYFDCDPRFRLPLNEIVFHDCFESLTHREWSGSDKAESFLTLTSLLYLCPPLYRLDPLEFENRQESIVRQYEFFSPLHKKWGFSAMTDFSWLTPDRMVQKTGFGGQLELIANFRTTPYVYLASVIPGRSILAIQPAGETLFTFESRNRAENSYP
ncbi:MAG: glycoside hydrolase [Candidatus Wallbacteria bacterium]|nr:glycoside hydrolase [Candidatus Wallbacteria bacterium]